MKAILIRLKTILALAMVFSFVWADLCVWFPSASVCDLDDYFFSVGLDEKQNRSWTLAIDRIAGGPCVLPDALAVTENFLAVPHAQPILTAFFVPESLGRAPPSISI